MPPPQRGNWRLTQFCGQQVLLLKEESNKWPKKRAFGVCGVHLTNGPPQCLTPERQGLNPNHASILVGRDFYCFKVPLNGFCKSDRIPGNFLVGDIFCKNVMMRASRVYKGRNIMKKVFKLLCKKSLLNRNWRTWQIGIWNKFFC